jgi:hypothetical protein
VKVELEDLVLLGHEAPEVEDLVHGVLLIPC